MQKKIEELYETLERDIQNYCKNIAKHITRKIADELTETTQSAINKFYSYKPKYYDRYGNFQYVYKRYHKSHGNSFTGGVELLVDEIPNVYTGSESDPLHVFDRVYSGLHGIASLQGYAPIMYPSPEQIIEDKFDYIKAHRSIYEEYGVKMARRDSYEMLKF